jgi:transposase
MAAQRKYPDELRERSIRMVGEAMAEDSTLSLNAAAKRIGPMVGVVPDTLRGWVMAADPDSGRAPGATAAEASDVRALQAQVRELRRANEILLAASSFFARELDPRLPW